jgi:hypothetical protein
MIPSAREGDPHRAEDGTEVPVAIDMEVNVALVPSPERPHQMDIDGAVPKAQAPQENHQPSYADALAPERPWIANFIKPSSTTCPATRVLFGGLSRTLANPYLPDGKSPGKQPLDTAVLGHLAKQHPPPLRVSKAGKCVKQFVLNTDLL